MKPVSMNNAFRLMRKSDGAKRFTLFFGFGIHGFHDAKRAFVETILNDRDTVEFTFDADGVYHVTVENYGYSWEDEWYIAEYEKFGKIWRRVRPYRNIVLDEHEELYKKAREKNGNRS